MTEGAVNAWLPSPLRALGGYALETVLNQVVALDPETLASLKTLEGNRVALHLRGPELAFVVHVVGGKLKVEPPPEDDDAATLHVSTTPGSLVGMALRGEDAAAPGKVEIAGDAELARRLEKLARNYAPDIEEALAQRFGDVIGVQLARALRAAFGHVRESGQHFAEDAADWLREEARIAVSPAEMDGFLDEVDALRERAERLEARVERVAARKAKGPAQ